MQSLSLDWIARTYVRFCHSTCVVASLHACLNRYLASDMQIYAMTGPVLLAADALYSIYKLLQTVPLH